MLQYGIMTGGSVSTMRAVTMFLIAMGARITGRIYDMMSALSVTAMMILVESPAISWTVDFFCPLAVFWEWGSLRKRSVPLQERRKNGQRHW